MQIEDLQATEKEIKSAIEEANKTLGTLKDKKPDKDRVLKTADKALASKEKSLKKHKAALASVKKSLTAKGEAQRKWAEERVPKLENLVAVTEKELKAAKTFRKNKYSAKDIATAKKELPKEIKRLDKELKDTQASIAKLKKELK